MPSRPQQLRGRFQRLPGAPFTPQPPTPTPHTSGEEVEYSLLFSRFHSSNRTCLAALFCSAAQREACPASSVVGRQGRGGGHTQKCPGRPAGRSESGEIREAPSKQAQPRTHHALELPGGIARLPLVAVPAATPLATPLRRRAGSQQQGCGGCQEEAAWAAHPLKTQGNWVGVAGMWRQVDYSGKGTVGTGAGLSGVGFSKDEQAPPWWRLLGRNNGAGPLRRRFNLTLGAHALNSRPGCPRARRR